MLLTSSWRWRVLKSHKIQTDLGLSFLLCPFIWQAGNIDRNITDSDTKFCCYLRCCHGLNLWLAGKWNIWTSNLLTCPGWKKEVRYCEGLSDSFSYALDEWKGLWKQRGPLWAITSLCTQRENGWFQPTRTEGRSGGLWWTTLLKNKATPAIARYATPQRIPKQSLTLSWIPSQTPDQ